MLPFYVNIIKIVECSSKKLEVLVFAASGMVSRAIVMVTFVELCRRA